MAHTDGEWRIVRNFHAGFNIENDQKETIVDDDSGVLRSEDANLIAQAPALLRAIGGFLWLGNNLHNIKHDPDRFRQIYEAAMADAKPAYDKAMMIG
jgi:hypothetical protein